MIRATALACLIMAAHAADQGHMAIADPVDAQRVPAADLLRVAPPPVVGARTDPDGTMSVHAAALIVRMAQRGLLRDSDAVWTADQAGYHTWDRDHDGIIDPAEHADRAATIDVRARTADAPWLFAIADPDGNGVVAKDEWDRWTAAGSAGNIVATIQVHDGDPAHWTAYAGRDGFVDAAGLARWNDARRILALPTRVAALFVDPVAGVPDAAGIARWKAAAGRIADTVVAYGHPVATADRLARWTLPDGTLDDAGFAAFRRTAVIHDVDAARAAAGHRGLFAYYDADRDGRISEAETRVHDADRGAGTGHYAAMGVGGQIPVVQAGITAPGGSAAAGYAPRPAAPSYRPSGAGPTTVAKDAK